MLTSVFVRAGIARGALGGSGEALPAAFKMKLINNDDVLPCMQICTDTGPTLPTEL
jgi:hypothetical protein